ncbi:tRNA (adenine(37)-N6)-methyltransferase isoform X1 [Capsicum annuum]|nr:tRNA (adenine(37)-N6)-methyltransferase isoform X1 [Capsicum annuum]
MRLRKRMVVATSGLSRSLFFMAEAKLLTVSIALTALTALAAAIGVGFWRRKTRADEEKIRELEKSLKAALQNCSAERQGRIRAQQALRKVAKSNDSNNSYPLAPIAITRSCFSTRNGTPRQPLIVPLARACLVFDPTRVPPASLEGLEGYSHCWIIYVFHLNTDLDKLWKDPSRSKFKAKVRVPRLKGERMGVFATRSPHRPCPIGLTVAKVDAVDGNKVFISGVDLVDGTPILDIKPYLPYCDSIPGAVVPDWVKVDNLLAITSVNFAHDFSASLNHCWSRKMEKKKKKNEISLYTSQTEFQNLIQQVLSWDIRSVSQRIRPHITENVMLEDDDSQKELHILDDIVYHLILEGLDISYKIDYGGNVHVEKIEPFQTEETYATS